MEEEIYKENVLDHYRNPRNKKEIVDCPIKERAHNPLCGDDITLYIVTEGEKIIDVGFTGHGCAISQAAISMLTEKIKNMDVKDAKKLESKDILEMLGIKISYQRTKCALLSLKVLHKAIGVENVRN